MIPVARRNIERMRAAATHEHPWSDIWQGLRDLGPAYVARMLTSQDPFARKPTPELTVRRCPHR